MQGEASYFYAFFRQALKKRIPQTEWPGRENE
jgi:hypothetical protein